MKKYIYLIILLFLSIYLISCTKSSNDSKNTSLNEIQKNNDINYSSLNELEINYLENIPMAPNNKEQNKENNKENLDSIDFKENCNKNNSSDINKNEVSSNSESTKEIETIKSENINDFNTKNENENINTNESNSNQTNESTSSKENTICTVDKFIPPKDNNFSLYINKESFKFLQEEINKLNSDNNLNFTENKISYNCSNGPNIEIYKTDEYYAIYLYCVLNENTENNEDINEIKMNNKVLKMFLSTITSTPNEVFDALYKDYEIDSTISETKYSNIGDCKIKSEIMQRYVIYYIK